LRSHEKLKKRYSDSKSLSYSYSQSSSSSGNSRRNKDAGHYEYKIGRILNNKYKVIILSIYNFTSFFKIG